MSQFSGESKTSTQPSTSGESKSSPTTPKFQRKWLEDKRVADVTEKLGKQLVDAALKFLSEKTNKRKRKNLKSATALRYLQKFDLLERNNCDITFSIGMSGDRFTVRHKPTWETMERGQLYVLVKSASNPKDMKMKKWADKLNQYNATAEGGEFAYSWQSMEAFLEHAEKTYMIMVEESRSTTTSPSRLSSGGSLRQTTSEQFRIIWDADDADTSHASEAKIRIMKEYEKMQEMNLTVTHGISMELTHSDNPFLWRVLLRNFHGSDLGHDLSNRFMIHGGETDAIELEVKFPATYPQDPPFIRIKKPILQEYTGRVSGGAICNTTLMKAGWDSTNRMHRVLVSIKEHLLKYEARVEHIAASPDCEYPLATCKTSWGYINDRVAPPLSRASGGQQRNGGGVSFSKDFVILSSSFVRECILPDSGMRSLAASLTDEFEASNKILIPDKYIYELVSGRTDLGSGSLVFQITTPMGLKCFCGILSGNAPEDNQIIVPDWMMKSMFIEDATKVNFAEIPTLDRCQNVTLQPIDSNFKNVHKETGWDTKSWLQKALQRGYSALTRGQTLTLGCNSTPKVNNGKFVSYNFILQSLHPDEPGVKLWNDYDFDLNVDFDDPLVSILKIKMLVHIQNLQ